MPTLQSCRWISEAAVTTSPSGPRTIRALLLLGILAAVIISASLGAAALLSRFRTPSAPPVANFAILVKTEIVELAATELWIDVGGRRIETPVGVTSRSMVDGVRRWTLETSWVEDSAPMRLRLGFASDGERWWIEKASVSGLVVPGGSSASATSGESASPSSGKSAGGKSAGGSSASLAPDDPSRGASSPAPSPTGDGWVTFDGGPWATTPLGQTFGGTLDLVADSAAGPVSLHLGIDRLAVSPPAPAVPSPGAPRTWDLGVVACSGALQLAPGAAEAKLRAMGWDVEWRWQHRTGPGTGVAEPRPVAPNSGFISSVSPGLEDGTLIVYVEDPARPWRPAASMPASCTSTLP
jgi:hypothetical protein